MRLNMREPVPVLLPRPPPAVWAEMAPPESPERPEAPESAWVADVPPSM